MCKRTFQHIIRPRCSLANPFQLSQQPRGYCSANNGSAARSISDASTPASAPAQTGKMHPQAMLLFKEPVSPRIPPASTNFDDKSSQHPHSLRPPAPNAPPKSPKTSGNLTAPHLLPAPTPPLPATASALEVLKRMPPPLQAAWAKTTDPGVKARTLKAPHDRSEASMTTMRAASRSRFAASEGRQAARSKNQRKAAQLC